MSQRELFQQRLDGSRAALDTLRDHIEVIEQITNAVIATLRDGGVIHTCGNGGSAAEAMHFAEELIGRYRNDRPPLPAVCLNVDPTALTCIANDFGFEQVFARQCKALLTEKDALIVLSTSGNSDNIVRALEAARKQETTTIGLLGRDGGRCAGLCDHVLIIDGEDSAHIQEAHLVVVHLICEVVEREFLA